LKKNLVNKNVNTLINCALIGQRQSELHQFCASIIPSSQQKNEDSSLFLVRIVRMKLLK